MKRGQLVCTLALIAPSLGWSLGCVEHAQTESFGEGDAPVSFRSPPTWVEIDSEAWLERERAICQ
jgi:hypothetical protein